jgi:hypothetical protein
MVLNGFFIEMKKWTQIDAGKFRLVINESKFTSGMNQKMITHQKQPQVETTYEKL